MASNSRLNTVTKTRGYELGCTRHCEGVLLGPGQTPLSPSIITCYGAPLHPERTRAGTLMSSLDLVAKIVMMGFSQQEAEQGLRYSLNDVSRAIEWIIANPQPKSPPEGVPHGGDAGAAAAAPARTQRRERAIPYTREFRAPISDAGAAEEQDMLRNSPPPKGRYMICAGSGAAVRAAPSRTSPLLGTLRQGHELIVTDVRWSGTAWRLGFDARELSKLWAMLGGPLWSHTQSNVIVEEGWFSLNTRSGEAIAVIVQCAARKIQSNE